jgi:hypothetical protein
MAERPPLVQSVVHDLLAVGGETSAFFRATGSLCGLTPVEAQVVYELAAGRRRDPGWPGAPGCRRATSRPCSTGSRPARC